MLSCGEKPAVQWLEQQFGKPFAEARRNLKDAPCYWREFIADKGRTMRNPGTIKRYNNLAGTVNRFAAEGFYRVAQVLPGGA